MERTFAEIQALIAELKGQIKRFKALAAERRAVGQMLIAEQQLAFVDDLEAKLAGLLAAQKKGS